MVTYIYYDDVEEKESDVDIITRLIEDEVEEFMKHRVKELVLCHINQLR